MRSLATLVGASALASILTACSGGSLGIGNALCTTVPLANVSIPEMVFPVPQYSKVPDNAMAMVVAYTADPTLAQTITIKPSNGSPIALGPFGAAPKQLPIPYVHHPSNGGTLYGVTLPKLQAHTTYSVGYRYAATAGLCGQSTTNTVPMGNFTTL
jgi:hypothetical protein